MQTIQIVLQQLSLIWKHVAVAVVFIILTLLLSKGCNCNKAVTIAQVSTGNENLISNSEVKVYTDKIGKLHAVVQNQQIEKQQLIKQLDSISALLKIKNKAIKAISYVGTGIVLNEKLRVDTFWKDKESDSLNDAPAQVVSKLDFQWQDDWIKINGTVGEWLDSIHITGTDTLKRVDYWKRKWFLGRKQYYSDFTNSNPHISVTGYKGVLIKDAPKQWSLGLYLGVGYDFTKPIDFKKPAISVGLSIQRSLIRF